MAVQPRAAGIVGRHVLEAAIKLDVAETWVGDIAVLAAAGTVDLRTAHVLSNATAGAIAKKPAALLIDLTQVKSLAPAATQVLVDARQLIGPDTGFAVIAVGPETSSVLHVMGLTRTLTVVATLGEALASARDENGQVAPSPPRHDVEPSQTLPSRDPSLELFGHFSPNSDRRPPAEYVGRHRAPE